MHESTASQNQEVTKLSQRPVTSWLDLIDWSSQISCKCYHSTHVAYLAIIQQPARPWWRHWWLGRLSWCVWHQDASSVRRASGQTSISTCEKIQIHYQIATTTTCKTNLLSGMVGLFWTLLLNVHIIYNRVFYHTTHICSTNRLRIHAHTQQKQDA